MRNGTAYGLMAAALMLLGAAPPQAVPKGYMVAQMRMKDPAGFARYAPQVPPLLAKYGGRYLVRGGALDQIEGIGAGERAVIIEFPSMKAAREFYHSPEYQAIAPLRQGSTEGASFLVEGVAP